MSVRVFPSIVITAFGQTTTTGKSPVSTTGVQEREPSITERLLQRLGPNGTFTSVPVENIPGIELAQERLGQKACATAVGGQQLYPQARLLTPSYFTLPSTMISAEQSRTGFQTVFAFSRVPPRRVFLFPSFWKPESVFTKLLDGGAKRISFLEFFEVAHGFRPGSITIEKLQAIILLHEQLHLNYVGLDDEDCLSASMWNTRYVGISCFPEIIDPNPKASILTVNINPREPKPTPCDTCHKKMGAVLTTSRPPGRGDKKAPLSRDGGKGKKSSN
jgi:hypothetical protein